MMAPLASFPGDILAFATARADEGIAVALVTLTGIEGSSPRAIGAQMAVAADGRYLGSFSGGCIEAAVVAEARKALAEGTARLVRFGTGSPYLDIRLPCGGGIDLLFTPLGDVSAVRDVATQLEARRQSALLLTARGAEAVAIPGGPGWRGDDFCLPYAPRPRITLVGQGEDLMATARLAQFFGAETRPFSPIAHDVEALAGWGIDAGHLATRSAPPRLPTDAWTALVFLFHDRDWEEALLPAALDLPCFYLGAVGSRRSHEARLGMLRAAGVGAAALASLRAPVGLIPSTRDPATLAMSLVADILGAYQAMCETRGPLRALETAR